MMNKQEAEEKMNERIEVIGKLVEIKNNIEDLALPMLDSDDLADIEKAINNIIINNASLVYEYYKVQRGIVEDEEDNC